jgi:hypothetical protein
MIEKAKQLREKASNARAVVMARRDLKRQEETKARLRQEYARTF